MTDEASPVERHECPTTDQRLSRRSLVQGTLGSVGGAAFLVPGHLGPAATGLAAPARTRPIQSVDLMKVTQDRVADQRADAQIADLVRLSKRIGATHVAIATPDDDPAGTLATDYTRRWIAAITAPRRKTRHRHMPLRFAGFYGYPKVKQDFRPLIARDIRNHPTFFQTGDIFSPFPEPQNGGIAGVNCAPNRQVCRFDGAADFNRQLRGSIATSTNAFADIGLGGRLRVGLYGFDGFVVAGLHNPEWEGRTFVEAATVAASGNVVSFDHHPPEGAAMADDLDTIRDRFPRARGAVSEWGPNAGTADAAAKVEEAFSAFRDASWIIAVNDWPFVDGDWPLVHEHADCSFRPAPLSGVVRRHFKPPPT